MEAKKALLETHVGTVRATKLTDDNGELINKCLVCKCIVDVAVGMRPTKEDMDELKRFTELQNVYVSRACSVTVPGEGWHRHIIIGGDDDFPISMYWWLSRENL